MTDDFRADLHCHSTCSDGTCTPEELVKHALAIGLKGLSITDHDTVDAYKTAIPLAEKLGLSLIIGVEFSTVHRDTSIHILGYNFSLTHPKIAELCKRHEKRRKERNLAILEKLRLSKMPIDPSEIAGDHTVGRPHIALAMMKHGYVRTIKEAFQRYIGDGKPCFQRETSISTEETIEIIHEAGGIAVLAHPHLITSKTTLKSLLKLSFDGIECYYALFPKERAYQWLDIAEKRKLIPTGGSDFHGENRTSIPLGASWVNLETFNRIKAHAS